MYTLDVTCSTIPSCTTEAQAYVDVQLPPHFTGVTVDDPASCNIGLELKWQAAEWRDPSANGTYNVYRSQTDCADAMSRPPIARGITALRWVDNTTRDQQSYLYVVQAEDARVGTVCAQGPNNGGAVNSPPVCVGPVTEIADPTFPSGVGWTLRASHVGEQVKFTWTGSRALLAGEHYHMLKGFDSVQPYPMINGENQLAQTWVETDAAHPVQYFDLRIANSCEVQSLDDEPPGYDH
jgi:hypothetical protein